MENTILAEQLRATQAALKHLREHVQKLTEEIVQLEAAEKVLLPYAPKVVDTEGKKR